MEKIENILKNENIEYYSFGGVRANPSLEHALEAAKKAIDFNTDFVLAIGSGSVIDTAKAIAHAAANKDIYVWDFFTFKIMRIMRRERPHVVFCSLMVYNSRVALAAHLTGGVKIVVRNNNDFTRMRKDKLLLCKATYPFANVIIAQQEEMKQDIINHIPKVADKVVVLQNPVDVSTIKAKANAPSPFPLDIRQNGCNYVCVARFAYAKGQDVLAKAFAILAKRNKDAHLYFVGKYDENDRYYKKVKQLVTDTGLDNRVHFVGFDDDPYRWMRHYKENRERGCKWIYSSIK